MSCSKASVSARFFLKIRLFAYELTGMRPIKVVELIGGRSDDLRRQKNKMRPFAAMLGKLDNLKYIRSIRSMA